MVIYGKQIGSEIHDLTKDDIQICDKENFKYELPNSFDLNENSDSKVSQNDEEIIASIVKKVNDATTTTNDDSDIEDEENEEIN